MGRLLFVVCCWLWPLAGAMLLSVDWASAEVFEPDWKMPGDGLLTYDGVNRREWLDVTQSLMAQFPSESIQDKFHNSRLELLPGRKFAGFTLAKSGDVIGLAQSVGIDSLSNHYEINDAATSSSMSLIRPAVTFQAASESS